MFSQLTRNYTLRVLYENKDNGIENNETMSCNFDVLLRRENEDNYMSF